jgi:hypothetical protein
VGPVLATAANRALLTWHGMLTCADVMVAWPVQAPSSTLSGAGRPGAGAVPDPDRARAQDAAQLTAARQVRSVTGAEREVLGLAGQIAGRVRPGWIQRGAGRRRGKPVVWVRPRRRLLGVVACPVDPVRQLRELVAAPLADRRERHRVPGQVQGDLIRLTRPVTACDRGHGQHGTIDAA